MNIQLSRNDQVLPGKAFIILISVVALLISLTILQDLVEADLKNSGFYISESFIFSSFWWLCIPFLYLQYYVIQRTPVRHWFLNILIAVAPALLHLVSYPVLIWVISTLFYDHTFRLQQTFQYGLSTYLIKLVLLYTVPLAAFQYFNYRRRHVEITPSGKIEIAPEPFIIVTEGTNRARVLVSDILYFTSNSPYINVHLGTKKYIHNETLRSILDKIESGDFVRIHKSTIVNVRHVRSYRSRLNGDYDLEMNNGTELRVSRNYAAGFRARFDRGHQVTLQ